MNEASEYTALRDIAHQNMPWSSYRTGEGVSLQVAEDLGLVVGEDIEPARANAVPPPAGNAPRAEWVRYAQFQSVQDGGPSQDDIDAMTRDQLRELYLPAEDKPARAKPPSGSAANAKGTAPVKGE